MMEQEGVIPAGVVLHPNDPRRLQAYVEALVQRGQPWPTEAWEKAWKAYGDDEDGASQRANLWPGLVDTIGAMTDEQPAHIEFEPDDAWAGTEQAEGQAQAETAMFEYIRRECDVREAMGMARHTADVQGIGAVLLTVDPRRGLPMAKALGLEQVTIDPDARNRVEDANWLAYWEYVTPEEIAAQFPQVDLEAIRKVSQVGLPASGVAYRGPVVNGTLPGAGQVEERSRRIRRYRLFLRNHYALYDEDPKTASGPDAERPHYERFRDRHGMNEPRRYIEFVPGLPAPLVDESKWPTALALDWDEWPIVFLSFAAGRDTVAGPSKYGQVEALLQYHDDAVGDAHTKSHLGNGSKCGGPPGSVLEAAKVAEFLGRKGPAYMPGWFDETGRAVAQPLSFPGVEQSDLAWIDLVRSTLTEIQGIPKIKQGNESEFSTATEAEIAADAATIRMNVRLRRFERFQSRVASQLVSMAHRAIPQLSVVDMPPELWGAPGFENVNPSTGTLGGVPAAALPGLLAIEGVEIAMLGADMILPPHLVAFWPDPGQVSDDLLRRQTRASVEQGSTQRRAALQKVAAFQDVWQRILDPLAQMLAMANPMAAMQMRLGAAKKVLSMLNLQEFESLLPADDAMMAALPEMPIDQAGADPAEQGV